MSQSATQSAGQLLDISVALIDRNAENPRLLFRPGELEQLLESIQKYGVQVPISVYREKSRYVLIDGERRWRCCLKLNKETIPALVQVKPAPLTNLLLMFNIHALREQWDLLTIAMKLPRVIALLTKAAGGTPPKERDLSAQTGLSGGVIRRCKLLMELPDEYKDTILDELKKPKSKQKLTEDFFIELERALKTVGRAMPELVEDKDAVRRVLIDKYSDGTISNIVQFRQVGKIARAEKVVADAGSARGALERLFTENRYGIEAAYRDSVQGAYDERDLQHRLETLIERLRDVPARSLDAPIRERLRELLVILRRLVGSSR
ncbi:MAG: ParB/RepB/Spo0J family partition protein [Gemmatimonadales bacterium]